MVGQDFLNLFTQPSVGQSSTGFVAQQPNPYSNLPPYITPTTPTPKGGSPFGDMSEKLDSKSQGLALMLYALGGALKGDKDFVQNTLALQQMQEGKKKQEAQKKAYQDILKRMEGQFDPRMIEFAKILPAETGTSILMSTIGKDREMFAGQGTQNQLYNVLLKGQQDPQLRSQPIYKTAYENLSRPTTETYINEQGQQVTRSIPGMINTEDYLPPIGAGAGSGVGAGVPGAVEDPSMADMMKPKDEEVVVEVSPERRKGLQSDLDVADRTISKIDNLLQTIIDIDPSPLTVGTERAIMSSAYKDLQLELKNYAELGVLTGPDLALLEDWVGNPMGFWQMFSGGAEGTTEQAKRLKQSILGTKNKILEELGKETVEIAEAPKDLYINGRKIIVKDNKWVFQDDGTIVPGQ